LLGKGADPRRRDKSGAGPIENAARGRHAEALGLLIAAAGPAAGEIGALLSESALKGQADIADLLLAKGANVNARDKSGATPLHQAALKGNLAFVTLLLQHGADVNARDGDGATPLHNAALSGHREVAALLLDKGADREARDTETGATPLYQAAAWGRTALVELLIKRGADVNARNKGGDTPLAAAVKNGFPEAAAILKQHGAR
jgi:cytohesin